MKKILIFLFLIFSLSVQAGIIQPLYVGNIEPILNQYNQPIKGSWSAPAIQCSLIEIRIAEDGIARPPYSDGSAYYKNPLLKTSRAGKNAVGGDSGLFCEVFAQRLNNTMVFGRAYNGATAEEATFYMDTPVYEPASKGSSLVLKFRAAQPIDPGDDDEDGLNNSWEQLLGIDDRLTSDYDGDGMSDLMEMLAGTAPDDPTSIFKINYINRDGNIVNIGWFSIPGKVYQLQHTAHLTNTFNNVDGSITAIEYETDKEIIETNIMMHYRVVIP